MPITPLFNEYYYSHDCGRPYQREDGWLTFFNQIAKRIIEQFNPKTVLDAGRAWGFLVEAFRNRGLEAFGIDISEYAIQNVHPEIRPYCRIGSITEPLQQEYDLITCIEVLEHVPMKEAERAIENICTHANEEVFSSTPLNYKEVNHINVHDPEFWCEQFACHGFYRDRDGDLSSITAWAARFIKTKRTSPKVVREQEDQIRMIGKQLVEKEQMASEKFAEKDHEVQLLKVQLSEILESRSWKYLEPLRKTYSRFRSRKQTGKG